MRSQFATIDFLFGVDLGKKVLTLADNLSKSLQAEALSASEGQAIAQSTVNALLKLRNEEKFAEFWKDVLTILEANDVSVPQLPRKRKVPARRQETAGEPHFPMSVKDHYRPVYFSAIDTVVQAIQQRFDQDGYRQYKQLEELLFQGCRGQYIAAELQNVQALYKDDMKPELLQAQLAILHTHFANSNKTPSIKEVVSYLQFLFTRNIFMSDVVVLVELILVSPATNVTSERSFSALRRLKTYLRNTMTQKRLNHCALLHVRKEDCDKLDLTTVGNDFIGTSEHRRNIFGNFDVDVFSWMDLICITLYCMLHETQKYSSLLYRMARKK